MFEQIERMRLYAPGNLLEQLEFYEQVEAVLGLLETSDRPRELLIEAWLLVDYITAYVLRDGIRLPASLEDSLKLLPFQFEKRLDLIRKLQEHQAKRLPNPKSYMAFELHPDFQQRLSEDKDLYQKFLRLAIVFEEKRTPGASSELMRNDYERVRFVSEGWFALVNGLDDEWFETCRRLNRARNIAAHKFKMTTPEIFAVFGVTTLPEFRAVLERTVRSVLFKPGT